MQFVLTIRFDRDANAYVWITPEPDSSEHHVNLAGVLTRIAGELMEGSLSDGDVLAEVQCEGTA